MGNGTNFDPNILEDAYNALARIATIARDSTPLKDIHEVSTIQTEFSGLEDPKGGWQFLADQVSHTTDLVSQYVSALQSTAASVHDAMRASIDTLNGADHDSKTAVSNSGKGVG